MFPGKPDRPTALPSKSSPGLKLSHKTIRLAGREVTSKPVGAILNYMNVSNA